MVHGYHRPRATNEWQHVYSKGHFVGPKDPADENHTERIECHERRIDGPFRLHNACVEKHETRDRLKAHE